MATVVIMPKQGQSVESCIIAKWHKKKGDKVNVGDMLFTYETDKATFDEEAKVEGTLIDVFFDEGDDVPCLTNVCVIGNEGESTAEFNPGGEKAETAAPITPAQQSETTAPAAAAPAKSNGMADAVIMPKQGQSVESCIIAKWHKKKGDKVNVGDMLFTYETDKATFDEESKYEGTLLDVFFDEGDDVPCLTNVCVIGKEGASTAEFNPGGAAAPAAETVVASAAPVVPVAPVAQAQATVNNAGIVKASPRAKNLAQRAGVDYTLATPTGPYGRIIERDINNLIENGPTYTKAAASLANGQTPAGTGIGGRITVDDLNAKPAASVANAPAAAAPVAETEEVKIPNIRKVIAKSMHASLSTMAQLTLNSSFDATEIMNFRANLKAKKDVLGLENITLNDIVLYAVSRTLLNHRDLNAHFHDDKMVYYNTVNLGVAVDTPRGLMVPTIFNAERKSLNQIAKESKMLAKQCQEGSVAPDLLTGGSFTVTNLGSLGVESFTPVINPPQTGILGVNNITQRAKEVDGEIKFYPAMGLSLTFDHRAVDGAPAAKFLKELAANLESFSVLLAK